MIETVGQLRDWLEDFEEEDNIVIINMQNSDTYNIVAIDYDENPDLSNPPVVIFAE